MEDMPRMAFKWAAAAPFRALGCLRLMIHYDLASLTVSRKSIDSPGLFPDGLHLDGLRAALGAAQQLVARGHEGARGGALPGFI